MTAPTLPGSIPGLLRRGSPVLIPVSRRVRAIGLRGVVWGHDIDSDAVHVLTADDDAPRWESPADVLLDLSDATGRAHAAWWAVDYCGAEALRACGLSLLEWTGIRDCATHGLNMSPASIESLRRVCLHVAGMTP